MTPPPSALARRLRLTPACALVVVMGPPAAGKSTYVDTHAGPGDVVIDLDRLALAIRPPGTGHYDYPDHVRRAAIAARLTLLDRLIVEPRVATLYLIHGRPDPTTAALYRHWHAHLVLVDPGEATVRARCHAQRPAHVLAEVDAWYRDPPRLHRHATAGN